MLEGCTCITSQEGCNETENFDDGLYCFLLHSFGVERKRRSSTSAKLQIFSESDKHRSPIGVASDLERILTIFIYILTIFCY